MWLPNAESPPKDLDLETSRFLLKQVGDHFCDLLIQEKESNAEHMSEGKQKINLPVKINVNNHLDRKSVV